jgi:hypothetical protein
MTTAAMGTAMAAQEGTRALRQSAQKIDDTPAWKEEVNRRVAEHKGRKIAGVSPQEMPMETQNAAGKRAATAAARVAARYAKAPSYSAMMAEEARAAVRAAEAASRAALEAQAAAEQVLAGLEAASSAEPGWEPEFFTEAEPEPVRSYAPPAMASSRARASVSSATPRRSYEVRWDADMPVREQAPAAARTSRGERIVEAPAELTWEQSTQDLLDMHDQLGSHGYEVVEPALPIHANLIEFPRELIATRKVRPRRVEGVHAATAEEQGQLSIFEVDPYSVSSGPEAAGSIAEANASTWSTAKWSGIELDEEPRIEYEAALPEYAPQERTSADAAVDELHVAPMNQRVMAAVVDFTLVSGAFLAAAFTVITKMTTMPGLKQLEVGSVVGLALMGLAYLAFFFFLTGVTPGMKYARLEILTVTGAKASREQRMRRMGALLVSMAPMGLGAAMALLDDQQLCWHDRLSGTYLKRG